MWLFPESHSSGFEVLPACQVALPESHFKRILKPFRLAKWLFPESHSSGFEVLPAAKWLFLKSHSSGI